MIVQALKKTVILVLISFELHGQLHPASCVNSNGFHFLSDAYLGGLGACNCEKASIFLNSKLDCEEGLYELTFEDNFDGDSLDLTKWQNIPWKQGALKGEQHLSVSTLDNVFLKDGICNIVTKNDKVLKKAIDSESPTEILADGEENLRTYVYSSCIFLSYQKFYHGKYEIRCKMPKGKGLWPGFWTHGGDRKSEIDIIDSAPGTGSEKFITNVIHDFDGDGKAEACNSTHKVGDLLDWHVYTCLFDLDKITFLFDDKVVRVVNRVTTVAGSILDCSDHNLSAGSYYQLQSFPIEPMFIFVSMAVLSDKGPAGSTTVDESTTFPNNFEIDYVRFWKRTNDIINVFPNPTSGIVNIKSRVGNLKNIRICNAQGLTIFDRSFDNMQATIDFSEENDGIYFVVIVIDGGSTVKKIIKIKG